jgi:hypothetical protein
VHVPLRQEAVAPILFLIELSALVCREFTPDKIETPKKEHGPPQPRPMPTKTPSPKQRFSPGFESDGDPIFPAMGLKPVRHNLRYWGNSCWANAGWKRKACYAKDAGSFTDESFTISIVGIDLHQSPKPISGPSPGLKSPLSPSQKSKPPQSSPTAMRGIMRHRLHKAGPQGLHVSSISTQIKVTLGGGKFATNKP